MDKKFNLNNYRPAGQRRGNGNATGAGKGQQQTPRTTVSKSIIVGSPANQIAQAQPGSSAVKPRSFLSPKLASRVAQATTGGVSQTPQATATAAASRAATGPGSLAGNRFGSPLRRFTSPSKIRTANSTSSTSSQATSNFSVKPSFMAKPQRVVSNGSSNQSQAPTFNTFPPNTTPTYASATTAPSPLYHELTSEEWLTMMYEPRVDGEVKQLDIWEAYEATFNVLGEKLSGSDFIHSISDVFPTAQPGVISDTYVIRGIERREARPLPPVVNVPPGPSRTVSKPVPTPAAVPVSRPAPVPVPVQVPAPAVAQDPEIVEIVNGRFVEWVTEGISATYEATPEEIGLYGFNYKGPRLLPGGPIANSHLYTSASSSSKASSPTVSLNGGAAGVRKSSTSTNTNASLWQSALPSAVRIKKNDDVGSAIVTATTAGGPPASTPVPAGMEDVAKSVLDLLHPVIESMGDKMQSMMMDRFWDGKSDTGKDKGKEKESERQANKQKTEEEILRALGILVDRMKDIGRDVKTISKDVNLLKNVLGVSNSFDTNHSAFAMAGKKRRQSSLDGDADTEGIEPQQVHGSGIGLAKRSVLERLDNIEMDVQEWLERLRDPMAGVEEGIQGLKPMEGVESEVQEIERGGDQGVLQHQINDASVNAQEQEVYSEAPPAAEQEENQVEEPQPEARIPTPVSVVRRDMATSPIHRPATPPAVPPVITPADPPQVEAQSQLPQPHQQPLKVHMGIGTTPGLRVSRQHAQAILIPVPTIPIGLNISPERGNKSVEDVDMEVRRSLSKLGRVPKVRGFEGDIVDIGKEGLVPVVADVEKEKSTYQDVIMQEPEQEIEASGNESLSSLSSLTSSGVEGETKEEQGTDEFEDQEKESAPLASRVSQTRPIVDSDDEPVVPKEDIFGPYRPNMAGFPSSTPTRSNGSWSTQKIKTSQNGSVSRTQALSSGSPSQGSSSGSTGLGPSSVKRKKGRVVEEDEGIGMADVEDAAGLGPHLSARSSTGSRKGKERASQSVSDAETESAWPVAFRRSGSTTQSTPKSKAHRTNDHTSADGSASPSGSGRSNSSGSSHRVSHGPPPMSTSTCISNASSTSSFSPVDWTKTRSGQEVQVVKLTPNAKLILNPGRPSGSSVSLLKVSSAPQTSPDAPLDNLDNLRATSISPSTPPQDLIPPQAMAPARSYTLPLPLEGSIAALRQETQGLAYPDTYVYSEKEKGSVEEERIEMVMGADAGERMLSPESQYSGQEDVSDTDPAPEPQKELGQSAITESEDVQMNSQLDEAGQEEQVTQVQQVDPVSDSHDSSILKTQKSVSTTYSTRTMEEDSIVSAPPISLVFPAPASPTSTLSPPRPPQTLPSQGERYGSPVATAFFVVPAAPNAVVADSSEVLSPQNETESIATILNSQSTSATAEDEEQVQSLVLDAITPATSPIKPQLATAAEVTATDADISVDTVCGFDYDGRQSHTQEVSTPKGSVSTLPTDESTSQPLIPALSLPSIECETNSVANEGMDVDKEPQQASRLAPPEMDGAALEVIEAGLEVADAGHAEASSPLFTSPVRPPYGDISWHTEDFDSHLTPLEPTAEDDFTGEIALEEIMHVDEVLTTPRAAADASTTKDKRRTSPDLMNSLPPSPVQVPSVLSTDKSTKQGDLTRKSPEIISLISSDEESEAPTGRLRPRKKAKVHIFDDPTEERKVKQEPVIIDITSPVRPATPLSRSRVASPVLPSTPPTQTRLDSLQERPLSPLTPLPSQYISAPPPVAPGAAAQPDIHHDATPNGRESDPTTAPETPFDMQKHAARLNDDDDADVIPVKPKKRKPSNADAGSGPTAPESNVEDVDMESAAHTKSEAAKNPEPLEQKTLLGGLLANKNKKKSAAVTRIKKRKRLEDEEVSVAQEEEDESTNPPPKRAKMRTSESGNKASKSSGTAKEVEKKQKKGKETASTTSVDTPKRYPLRSPKPKVENITPAKTPTRRPRGQGKGEVKWPNSQKPNFDQYVRCDQCDRWYHIGCVGVEPDAVCLRPTEIYICPICKVVDKDKSPAKNAAPEDGDKSDCCRPDCLLKKKKKKAQKTQKAQVVEQPQENEMYEVESFVGRYKRFVGGQGIREEYLVKWQGYEYNEATWEPLENMCLSDPGPLLHAFETEAKAQGINLNDGKEVVIFKQAAAAGWLGYMNFRKFVKPE